MRSCCTLGTLKKYPNLSAPHRRSTSWDEGAVGTGACLFDDFLSAPPPPVVVLKDCPFHNRDAMVVGWLHEDGPQGDACITGGADGALDG